MCAIISLKPCFKFFYILYVCTDIHRVKQALLDHNYSNCNFLRNLNTIFNSSCTILLPTNNFQVFLHIPANTLSFVFFFFNFTILYWFCHISTLIHQWSITQVDSLLLRHSLKLMAKLALMKTCQDF